jgi:hypothetical protein
MSNKRKRQTTLAAWLSIDESKTGETTTSQAKNVEDEDDIVIPVLPIQTLPIQTLPKPNRKGQIQFPGYANDDWFQNKPPLCQRNCIVDNATLRIVLDLTGKM